MSTHNQSHAPLYAQAAITVSLQYVFLISIIILIGCCIADWIIAYKTRRMMLQGATPSTFIMITLCLFFAASLGNIGTVLTSGDFSMDNYSSGGLLGGTLILLAGLVYLLTKGIKLEFRRFKEFICAVKKAKA